MNNVDKQYLDLMRDIMENGVKKQTRAGAVRSIFGRMLRFNLKDGLPILTTKKVFSRGCTEELLWFLSGSTNIKYLVERNVHIWDDDAYRYYNTLKNEWDGLDDLTKEEFIEDVKKNHVYLLQNKKNPMEAITYTAGDLNDVYGKQWRSFGVSGRDQIADVIDKLRNSPDDRRMLVVAFNPDVLDKVALPPCHVMFQFYTKELPNGKRELSCMWSQRSVDCCLGLPYNLLSYSELTHMIAQCCDMEVGEILCSLGDVHIYENQIDGVMEQLQNDPTKYDLPKLELNPNIKNIDDFTIDDIKIVGYESYPKIYFPLSVG